MIDSLKPTASVAWGRSVSAGFRRLGEGGEVIEKVTEKRPAEYAAILEGNNGKLPGVVKRFDMPPPETITPTSPLRLSVAAKIAFPDGSMSAKALRTLGSSGRLAVELIQGKHFTTLANIEEMRSLCRVKPKVQDLNSSNEKPVRPSGTSVTPVALTKARAALRASLNKPSLPSRGINSKSTIPRGKAKVIPIKPQ
jgi:hypothetical protein